MNWLSTNYTYEQFIKKIISHAWFGEDDAPFYYIDKAGKFYLTSVRTCGDKSVVGRYMETTKLHQLQKNKDETAASKVIVEAAKKYQDKVTVKCAYVDGGKVDVNGVNALAAMPSKEELVAKMLGSLQAPISNFVGVLSAMPRSLVIALNAIAEKKAQ